MSTVEAEGRTMRNEVGLLNIICILAALLFVGLAVVNALVSGELINIDNLFVTMVCMVMALMFAVNPLLYLKSEGRLPLPFKRGLISGTNQTAQLRSSTPPMLDAKGRPMPPDVRSIVASFGQSQQKDV
jgi:hypothetical protein